MHQGSITNTALRPHSPRRSASSLAGLALLSALAACADETTEADTREGLVELTPIYTVLGDGPTDWFGCTVTTTDDIDGDGLRDLAVGAHRNKSYGHGEPGYVRVLSGKDGKELYRLVAGGEAKDGPDDHFGFSIALLDDLDDDGVGELIVGAYLFDDKVENEGAATIFSGKTGELLFQLRGPEWGDRYGVSVNAMPDMDGDGLGDMLLGVSKDDDSFENAGSVIIVSSRSREILVQGDGPSEGAAFGWKSEPAGDVNADGIEDFIGGAALHGDGKGYAAVHSGQDGALLHSWLGTTPKDYFGDEVEALGDVDGDGHADLIVAAFQSEYNNTWSGPGYVIAYSGKTGAPLWRVEGDAPGDQFGWNTTRAGDWNGDGIEDLFISAAQGISVAKTSRRLPGYMDLVSGADGTLIARITGASPDGQFGTAVSVLDDLDGDGVPELAVGSSENEPGQARPGRVEILSGAAFQSAPGDAPKYLQLRQAD